MKTVPVLFLYLTVPALMDYHIDDTAYAVAFFAPKRHSLEVMDLSYILIRFMDKFIRASDYSRFNLLSFSFTMDSEGTYGVLILDKNFRRAYRIAQRRAHRNPGKYSSAPFDIPISTWPSNSMELRDARTIFNLKTRAE